MAQSIASDFDRTDAIIRLSFARFDIRALATALGFTMGAMVWVATAALLVKASGSTGEVGPHLSLLARFFPGYSVTWVGSFVGFAYGFVLGFMVGTGIALSWNLSHYMLLMRARGRYGHGGDL
jgi:hypothetical protein